MKDNDIKENVENNEETKFSSFTSSRTYENSQAKAERDDYTSSLTGTLESDDSYERELTDQIESANEESYYESENMFNDHK